MTIFSLSGSTGKPFNIICEFRKGGAGWKLSTNSFTARTTMANAAAQPEVSSALGPCDRRPLPIDEPEPSKPWFQINYPAGSFEKVMAQGAEITKQLNAL